jgi:hypothetical protein
VRAPATEVYFALADLGSLSRWWPGVHSTSLRDSPAIVGRRARLEVSGLLPAPLHADVEITSAELNREIGVTSHGQLEGSGEWRLRQSDGITDAIFSWDVRLEHHELRRVARYLRPLLVLSHRFVMWRGNRGLRRMLENNKAVVSASR